ncbi:MAG: hypothetical protein ABF723_07210 [Lentilactobacillus hilgardii]|jgi:ABC-type bacteriocin/lantibiotic exporter with double-glycine peptidase domain|uniref:Uncharacterized protein n=1 Tax=Lentilactobacillus hilgardii TaxID=1588 RepID=A0A6P1E9J3_LENHI|nr:hypothetical protein [Lentilactobacillus hilgardii]MCI2019148.1 hypothetical protein [Lentilactobacillus buchneri]RRG07814.1 MAG: hypothetical protein DUD35_12810 [Lactobacillus sp.]EEI72368.1 hypothetical protein HMPREF0496_0235 [Lentilactobacillus hilgardii ATCC 27305]MBZ2201899.1 hypothetical protein [Lentilactobacillus hilgardii]MBZ2204163.1 hypothetical protein [Lentilactobacillus hilgardii]
MRLLIGIGGLISLLLCIGAIVLLFLGNEALALPLVIVGTIIMILSWLLSDLISRKSKKK